MRGDDQHQLDVFSYVSAEQRIPQDHPLRLLRAMANEALQELQSRFRRLYAKTGRPSIAPAKLLRALLQVLYSVRSERMLVEQLNYKLLFHRFVGLNIYDRSGMQRCLRRTVSVCSTATLPMLSSPPCSSRQASGTCFRMKTSPSMERC